MCSSAARQLLSIELCHGASSLLSNCLSNKSNLLPFYQPLDFTAPACLPVSVVFFCIRPHLASASSLISPTLCLVHFLLQPILLPSCSHSALFGHDVAVPGIDCGSHLSRAHILCQPSYLESASRHLTHISNADLKPRCIASSVIPLLRPRHSAHTLSALRSRTPGPLAPQPWPTR